MSGRLTTLAVVVFWLAAMGWLVNTKILPALREGNPPDYRDEFVREEKKPPPPVAWDLFWNERPMGMTVSQAYLTDGEPSEVRTLVQFENLELREITRELLGGMSFITGSFFGGGQIQLDLDIATRLRLDWQGELQSFETAVRASDEQSLLFIRGQRDENDRLRLSIYPGGESTTPINHEVNMPTKARYADAFSPRSRMENLSIGQQWTTPVVSPLGSSNSIRLVESLVEKKETITWQEQEVETFVVVYRYDSGSGNAARDPVGRVWVREDGVVIRQELPIGTARVRFERTSDDRARELAKVLDGANFDRYLNRVAIQEARSVSEGNE